MQVQTTHLQPCAPSRWMLGSPARPGRVLEPVDAKVDIPCGECLDQWGQTWMTAFSPHATARGSPVRTGTMAISSGPKQAVLEVPSLPRQQEVPAGSAQNRARGHRWLGMQGDWGHRIARGHRTACPQQLKGWQGPDTAPDPVISVWDTQGVGHQPLDLGTATALLQRWPALLFLG